MSMITTISSIAIDLLFSLLRTPLVSFTFLIELLLDTQKNYDAEKQNEEGKKQLSRDTQKKKLFSKPSLAVLIVE